MTDPIADYLTRIRNAVRARHKKVDVPVSNLKREITKILLQQKFINNFAEVEDGDHSILRIYLKYQGTQNAITAIRRVSTPGRRVYADKESILRVLGGLGVAIVSTSKGVMTDKEAKRQNVGGEILCHIW